MNRGRRTWLGAAGTLLLGAAWPQGAHAQAWPAKPIRVIVPFPPGGAVDYYARIVQGPVGERLGQPIVIDSRPGASGMIGADLVAKAAPDGYTLLLGNIASLAINAGIYDKMSYDPVADFTPILHVDDVNYVLVVNASVPVRTPAELVAYAKAHPGTLSYGSAGSGSLPQLAMELFKQRTGTDFVHVPYKGGGPMVTDIVGGQTQVTIADQANLMPHVATGKLRALAVSSPKRSTVYPDLPTIAETLPGFEATAWQALVGPAGLPADVVKRINEAFNQAMADPAVRKRMIEGGLDPVGGTPEALGAFIRSEKAKWTQVARSVGAKAD
jgi:tripartite-type tricarboxylate transporter receptor subunit TctC